jgi:peroxin-1
LQVRIVNEGMRFPLWLHGGAVITFLVVSTSPKRAVGKMMSATFHSNYSSLMKFQ